MTIPSGRTDRSIWFGVILRYQHPKLSWRRRQHDAFRSLVFWFNVIFPTTLTFPENLCCSRYAVVRLLHPVKQKSNILLQPGTTEHSWAHSQYSRVYTGNRSVMEHSILRTSRPFPNLVRFSAVDFQLGKVWGKQHVFFIFILESTDRDRASSYLKHAQRYTVDNPARGMLECKISEENLQSSKDNKKQTNKTKQNQKQKVKMRKQKR